MLVEENRNEILTAIGSWPETIVDGVARPTILVV
jgi:hypothetical protein